MKSSGLNRHLIGKEGDLLLKQSAPITVSIPKESKKREIKSIEDVVAVYEDMTKDKKSEKRKLKKVREVLGLYWRNHQVKTIF